MRIKGLDFLRGCAIVLVLFRHGDVENILSRMGWIGVDLFFGLSGFLVSGLLFKEYLHSKKVDTKRFLIRRGFKIYPLFYIFVLFAIVLNFWETKSFYNINEILSEVFYLQSYLPHVWDQTWSLAVEEHFYLALAFLIPLSIRTNKLEKVNFMLTVLFSILLISFLMRLYISYPHQHDFFSFYATHLRMDGIVVGILCSYLYYFTDFYSYFLNKKIYFIVLAVLFILPVFIFDGGGFLMNTIGLSTVNIGFGILVLLALQETKTDVLVKNQFFKLPFKIMCFIGIHSYAIYLWHFVAKKIVGAFDLSGNSSFSLYFILAIIMGAVLSYAIEKPFLRYRENFSK